MGYEFSTAWRSAMQLRRDYASKITPAYRVVGWSGNFLKLIHKESDRPLLVNVLVANGGNLGYGYKAIRLDECCPHACSTNKAAARWLRKELDKRHMAPLKQEANWLVYCDRMAEYNKRIDELKRGDNIRCIEPFDTTNGVHFPAGYEFIVKYVTRTRIHVTTGGWDGYSLSKKLFFERPRMMDDYPIVAVK